MLTAPPKSRRARRYPRPRPTNLPTSTARAHNQHACPNICARGYCPEDKFESKTEELTNKLAENREMIEANRSNITLMFENNNMEVRNDIKLIGDRL